MLFYSLHMRNYFLLWTKVLTVLAMIMLRC